MRKSLNFISSKFDELQKENKEMRKSLNEEIKARKRLTERVEELEEVLESGERSTVRNNIVMSGIERQERRERTTEIVLKVLKAMNININESEIVNARRMDDNKESSPIIVELKTKDQQNEILKTRKTIGAISTVECSLKGKTSNIYINEQLTRRTSNLFFRARETKKDKLYKYLWTRENKIYIKKSETSNKIRIKSIEDLISLQ